MKSKVTKSLHNLASLHVKTKMPGVEKSRYKNVLADIDYKVNRMNQSREDSSRVEKAYAFIDKISSGLIGGAGSYSRKVYRSKLHKDKLSRSMPNEVIIHSLGTTDIT